MSNFGKIITMSAGKAFRKTDLQLDVKPSNAYLITFSTRLVNYAKERGWNYSPELAPSSFLFAQVQERKKDVNVDRHALFHDYYKPKYMEGLENPLVLQTLEQILVKIMKGENVLLVCFCGEDKYCHRSILKDILELALPKE